MRSDLKSVGSDNPTIHHHTVEPAEQTSQRRRQIRRQNRRLKHPSSDDNAQLANMRKNCSGKGFQNVQINPSSFVFQCNSLDKYQKIFGKRNNRRKTQNVQNGGIFVQFYGFYFRAAKSAETCPESAEKFTTSDLVKTTSEVILTTSDLVLTTSKVVFAIF